MLHKKPRILVVGSFVMDVIAATEKIPGSGQTVFSAGAGAGAGTSVSAFCLSRRFLRGLRSSADASAATAKSSAMVRNFFIV